VGSVRTRSLPFYGKERAGLQSVGLDDLIHSILKGASIVPRIAGVDLPDNKRVEVGLTYIYGIGRSRSNDILETTDIDPDRRVKDLAEDEVTRLRAVINRNYSVEGDLRREVRQNIQRLVDINCYRGIRHRRGLPVRGQRTKTNARTRKGPRKTVAGRGRRRGAKKK
jgi:small subunit ribosomal protein S13